MKKQLEKYIEKKVCDYAKIKGWLQYKFSSPSCRSVPDRLFIKSGKVIFIEFKASGKLPTEAQSREIEKIKSKGIPVFVVDSLEKGESIIDAYSQ